jgi:hypothetical protein
VPGAPIPTREEPSLDQPQQRLVNAGQIGERVHPLAALLELAGRLGAAQHQHADDRLFAGAHRQCLRKQVPVLRSPAAGAAGHTGEPATLETVQRIADDRVVVVDHRIPVGGLVARQPQRVERQRVGIGGRSLLLQQAAEHSRLRGGQVHRLKPTTRRRPLQSGGATGAVRGVPISMEHALESAP